METIGQLVGVYDSKSFKLYIDYVGETLSKQKIGTQSFVATKEM